MATSLASSTPVRDDSEFTEKLLSGLRQFYDEQKLVDVTFKVSNPTVLIPAHRLVLSAGSSYFENLFTSAQGLTPFIEIADIASDTFERLITYCYTGKTLITHDNVAEMLKGSIILQLNDAVVNCVDYIFENITEYTLERAYSLEGETQCERLREKIEEYEIQHFMEISGSAEFLNFDSEKLKRILENEELNVSCEEDVFAAIKTWYEHDIVSRERHLPDLIGCLRLLQFDTNFVLTNIQPLPGCESLALRAIVWCREPLARTKISLKFSEPRESLRQQLEETSYLAVERITFGFKLSDTKCLLRYNKTEEKWLKYAELDIEVDWGYRVILRDDNLIFIGGEKNGRSTNEVRSWNLRTKTWKPLPAMTCPRESPCVALLDGKIYAIGGRNEGNTLASVEVLSSTGEWHCVGNMKTPRFLAAAVTLNGQIFVMGGTVGCTPTNTVERYDPTTNVWTSCADMNNSYWRPGAAVHKGFIFVVGEETAERYDPHRDEWTEIRALPAKLEGAACISLNNQLWVIGGGTSDAYIYDEERDRWMKKADLPKAGYYSCFTVPETLL